MSGIEKVDTHPMPNDNEILTFGIIGLGYVGLPLAVQAAMRSAHRYYYTSQVNMFRTGVLLFSNINY